MSYRSKLRDPKRTQLSRCSPQSARPPRGPSSALPSSPANPGDGVSRALKGAPVRPGSPRRTPSSKVIGGGVATSQGQFEGGLVKSLRRVASGHVVGAESGSKAQQPGLETLRARPNAGSSRIDTRCLTRGMSLPLYAEPKYLTNAQSGTTMVACEAVRAVRSTTVDTRPRLQRNSIGPGWSIWRTIARTWASASAANSLRASARDRPKCRTLGCDKPHRASRGNHV